MWFVPPKCGHDTCLTPSMTMVGRVQVLTRRDYGDPLGTRWDCLALGRVTTLPRKRLPSRAGRGRIRPASEAATDKSDVKAAHNDFLNDS
jgi:hypothetical protein